jgi:hypothetical protein
MRDTDMQKCPRKQEQKVSEVGEVGDSKLEKLWVFGESVCILHDVHPLQDLFART